MKFALLAFLLFFSTTLFAQRNYNLLNVPVSTMQEEPENLNPIIDGSALIEITTINYDQNYSENKKNIPSIVHPPQNALTLEEYLRRSKLIEDEKIEDEKVNEKKDFKEKNNK